MKIIIEISRTSKHWSQFKLLNKNLIKKVLRNVLNRFINLKKIQKIELSILLTDDPNMQYLNDKFRGKNSPTNVLSFPTKEIHWEQLFDLKPDLNYMYLGDIAFSLTTILSEAKEQDKPLDDHFLHLLIHSILHLLGFDHEYEKDAVIMQQLEVLILKDFSICSPY